MNALRDFLSRHRIKIILLFAALMVGFALYLYRAQINWQSLLSLPTLFIGLIVAIIFSLWIIWVVPKKQIATLTNAQADKEPETTELPAEILALTDGIEALPESKTKTEVLQPKELFELENEARKTIAQIVGGVVVIVGLIFTGANLWITEQVAEKNRTVAMEGQITDRYTKAIAQLGDPKLEVRLGGIFALERIAKDSPKDQQTIMEVLTAFVRETTAHRDMQLLDNKKQDISTKPTTDIIAILTVIARRSLNIEKGSNYQPDLKNSRLARANLEGLNLREVDLRGADLRGADLHGADLRGTRLEGANLEGADLHYAQLQTLLDGANLREANLYETDFGTAVLFGANLIGCKDLYWYQIKNTWMDENTKLPSEFEAQKKEKVEQWRKEEKARMSRIEGNK